MKPKPSLLLILCAFYFSHTSFSQPAASDEKVKVFLDCARSCDFDYVRTEMKMVDYVRDRFQSDVHVMITEQYSSSGGTQHRLSFLGQKRFAGMNDTLTYFDEPGATDDANRKQLVQYLKLGLTRYIAKTGFAKKMEISAMVDTSSTATNTKSGPVKDKWNYWVYQFGGNASFNGDQNTRSSSWGGYLNANRETEEWKTKISLDASRSVDVYKDTSGDSKFLRKNYSGEFEALKSINQHWSVGVSSSYQKSLYNNIRDGMEISPKLEYSVLPYKKFNSDRIVVQYSLGLQFIRYYDTTIYFKTKESQLQQSIRLITSFNKPWGSINIGMFFSNYFDDFSKNNLSFNGAVSWNIVKGLQFGIYGYYALIHDQIGLRKGQASRDQLLIHNRELLSSFGYNLGFGFSYHFGSVSNSIVNPRFKGLNYSINF